MNPGKEARLLHLLLLVVQLPHALLQELPVQGNVGCLFSEEVCLGNEFCFDDLVLGQCVSASSSNEHHRLGPLVEPALGLLGAEMRRVVVDMGLSWRNLYTQCVFQTLLHHIQHIQPYSTEECSHLLPAQQPGRADNHFPEILDLAEMFSPQDLAAADQEVALAWSPWDLAARKTAGSDLEAAYPSFSEADTPEEENYGLAEEDQKRLLLHLLQVVENLQEQHPEKDLKELVDLSGQPAWDLAGQPGWDLSGQAAWDLSGQPAWDGLTDDEILYIPNDIGEQPSWSEVARPDEEVTDWSSYFGDGDSVPSPPFRRLLPALLPPLDDDAKSAVVPENDDNAGKEEEGQAVGIQDSLDSLQTLADSLTSMDQGEDQQAEQVEDRQVEVEDQQNLQKMADFLARQEDDKLNNNNMMMRRRQRRDNDEDNWTEAKDIPEKDAETEDGTAGEADGEDDTAMYDFDYNDSSASVAGDGDDAVYYSLPETAPALLQNVFDRRERLDVKKPGPFFTNSQNNFFLDKLLRAEEPLESAVSGDYEDHDPGQTEYEMPLATPGQRQKKDVKVEPVTEYAASDLGQHFLVINIKNRFKTLGQANSLVDLIADQLQVPPQSFGEPRIETSRVWVLVGSNPRLLNATTMADLLNQQVEAVRERADTQVGVIIDSFAAGDENEVVSVYTGNSRLFLSLFLLAAGLATLLLMAALLLVLRRRRMAHKITEAKPDKTEPVNEYKQLVRDWSRTSRASQGSQGGGAGGGEEGGGGGQHRSPPRHPLAPKSGKTSQNSEGSRTSSTSSWQEEPGVSTMDISTGHMVLNYMEDHLKNKQRLEQEWVGLCAYEAEPASTSVAFKVENKKKNRYPDKLPYDHNRVLLNALINGSNSDYINASTVTDHDPRNPAYIVTQGPMAHTVADFWQMVWEQGSVVLVMLSRLAENGYQLAHRYWPEEGSEQYHIYEVHLVSEHVWCDDYLVRSLYLKNTQTNETRTVTQFHFLSWPDAAIPTSTKALLEFRRKVNKSYRGRSCPIIIHCSDGVGRSGTYILIDMVLNRMTKGSKEIDIAATLEHIRDQRSGMVQTRSQFEFCLTAVAEETHAILKSLAQQ